MDPYRALEVTSQCQSGVDRAARALPPALRVVHLIGRLRREMMLGGVYGWLIDMGEHGPDTANALDTVGAHDAAAVVRQVLSPFPDGRPAVDHRERARQMDKIDENPDVSVHEWRDLGSRLLGWVEDLDALLQPFVDEHEAEFMAAERTRENGAGSLAATSSSAWSREER
jgi:hypothetical protein